LNELKAIDLLFEAEDQMQFFYGFNRGLTAVLLYFDCKKLWVNFLRTLILAMPGRTWPLDEHMPSNISNWLLTSVEKLIQNGLVQNICSTILYLPFQMRFSSFFLLSQSIVQDQLLAYDWAKTEDGLLKANGLGNLKHRKLVINIRFHSQVLNSN